jgi:spermidine synthase
MLKLARTDGYLSELNRHSFADPRVRTVTSDAFSWLRHDTEKYDAVIVDMPDPDAVSTAKLYSEEFYGMVRRTLAPGGRVVVQSTSPFFAAKSFWCIARTIQASGFGIRPYHVDVPSFGDWGFVLAAPGTAPGLALSPEAPSLRFLDDATLQAAGNFAKDLRRDDVKINTLMDPVLVRYEDEGWRDY